MIENKIKQSEVVTVRRSEINFAPYNPRKISDKARKQLKANLKRVGLLGGVVWNKRTGNLVSGHQKVGIMDEVNKYNPQTLENEYELRVEAVDLDEKSEKEQNLFMNNRSAQGEFDDDMLREMFEGIDYSLAGFDDFDVDMLGIGGTDDINLDAYNPTEWDEKNLTEDNEDLQSFAAMRDDQQEGEGISRKANFYEDTPENQIARHREIEKIKERIGRQNDIDNDNGALSYAILSFKSPSEKADFMTAFGYESGEKIIDGVEFWNRVEFGESE